MPEKHTESVELSAQEEYAIESAHEGEVVSMSLS